MGEKPRTLVEVYQITVMVLAPQGLAPSHSPGGGAVVSTPPTLTGILESANQRAPQSPQECVGLKGLQEWMRGGPGSGPALIED